MKYNIIGKNIQISDKLSERINSKFQRLEKLFPQEAEAQIKLSVEKLDHIIEVTIPLKKRLLRADVRSFDMYAAIDEIVDVLERQMVKYKNKLRDRARRDMSYKEELETNIIPVESSDANASMESGSKIERIKRFALKPMDAEEATMEMELLGHNFFVFRDGDTDEVNVVYKRKNGTYGLIEPEF